MKKIPKKLNKEPLIDVIFELRFESLAPASNILPGVLFNKFPGDNSIEKLSTAQIPEQIRANDPNLKFSPVVRLNIEKFFILIGDNSMAVACKLPYPGWDSFKDIILKSVDHLQSANIVKSVTRYSLKYIDLISYEIVKKTSNIVDLDLSLGQNKVDKEIFQIKVEMPDDDFINVVQIISNASFTVANTVKTGLVVDIDTINNISSCDMTQLKVGLSEQLEKMHTKNTNLFFECLQEETIQALEPTYE